MMHKLNRITLDTNPEDCNLNCIMCEEHSKYSTFKKKLLEDKGIQRRVMPKEWIKNIIADAKLLGVHEIIPSTMGEPLLYQHFNEIIKGCKNNGIKLNLTTNGTFPIHGVDEWAEILLPILSDVKISINGSSKSVSEKIMCNINFEQQLYNIETFIKKRNEYFTATGQYSSITFQLTFMKSNMHELTAIIEMASKLGIDRVKGHQLWTHFEEIKEESFLYNPENISIWNTYVKQAHDKIEELKVNGFHTPILENITAINTDKKSLIPEAYQCPFLGKEIWVSATGKYSPCCAPDELRQSLGDFGNAKNLGLNKLINSEKYLDLLNNYKTKSLCKTCTMRKPL